MGVQMDAEASVENHLASGLHIKHAKTYSHSICLPERGPAGLGPACPFPFQGIGELAES